MIQKMLNKCKDMPLVAKTSIVYVLANLICKGFSVITIPFFTHIMPTSEIGIVSIFNSWWGILSTIGTLALTSGGFFTAITEFEKDRNAYKSSILSLISVATLILFFIFRLNVVFWESFFGLNKVLISIMLLSIALESAKDIWMMCQRFEYKYKAVFGVTVIITAISSMVSIILVYLAKKAGYKDLATIRLLSTYIIFFVVDIVLFFDIMRKGKTVYNKQYWFFSLQISIPLIFNALAKNILDVSDRLMIANFVGTAAAGIYSTLYSLSSLVVILWNAINSSFVPYLFQGLKKGDDNLYNDVGKFINPLLFLYGLFAILVTLIAPEMIKLFTTNEYLEAMNIIPAVVAGVFLVCLYNLFSSVLVYYKKTKYIMISTVIACVINIGLNYLLIPKMGYLVAAYTTLIAYIVLAYTQYKAMRKVTQIRIYNIKYFGIMSIIIITICLCLNLLYNFVLARYFIFGIVAIFGFIWCKKRGIDIRTLIGDKKD